jgi:hypothetical protein
LPPGIGGLLSDVDVARWLGQTLEVQRDIGGTVVRVPHPRVSSNAPRAWLC